MEEEEDEVKRVGRARARVHDAAVSMFYTDVHVAFPPQNGLNALHLAAKEGHKDLVEELLDRGAPVDSSTKVDNWKQEVGVSPSSQSAGARSCFI